MRFDNLLHGDRKFRHAWDWADGPNQQAKLDSLLFLVEHLDRLPSPVFFEVPKGAALDPDWKKLVDASTAHCACPWRRMLWPERGRSRLLTREPDGKKVVTLTHNDEYRAKHSFGAPPVYLAPHGGDVASSFARLAIDGGDIIFYQRPLMPDGSQDAAWYTWALTPHAAPHIGRYPSYFWKMSLATAATILKRDGEIVLMQVIPDPLGDGAVVGVPMCSVVEVERSPIRGAVQRFTLEVDGGIRVFSNLSEGDTQQHICAP